MPAVNSFREGGVTAVECIVWLWSEVELGAPPAGLPAPFQPGFAAVTHIPAGLSGHAFSWANTWKWTVCLVSGVCLTLEEAA